MAQPGSRSELIDYCKRQLGAPVLEINVADEQIDDIVDDAIQYFQERHFDGVSQMYMKYKVTQNDINRGWSRLKKNKSVPYFKLKKRKGTILGNYYVVVGRAMYCNS